MARRGLVDWPRPSAIAVERLRRAPGSLTADELRATEPAYAAAMAADRAARCRRRSAPSCRASSSGPASSIGPAGSTPTSPRSPRSSASSRASCSTRSCRPAAAWQGDDGAREPLRHDPPARLPARVHGLRRSSASTTWRCCRPRRRRAGCCSSRRTSAGTATALDLPLEPFRTLDRPARDHPRLRVRGAPVAPALPRRAPGAPARACSAARRAASAGMRSRSLGRAMRGESDGAEHWMERLMTEEQRRLFRETQAVMSLLEGFSDYVMDEVGRDLVPGVERISARFHERRSPPVAVRARGHAPDRHGPEAGAVPEGRAVRLGDRRCRGARPRSAGCGTVPRRCRGPRRSTTRLPGFGAPGSTGP